MEGGPSISDARVGAYTALALATRAHLHSERTRRGHVTPRRKGGGGRKVVSTQKRPATRRSRIRKTRYAGRTRCGGTNTVTLTVESVAADHIEQYLNNTYMTSTQTIKKILDNIPKTNVTLRIAGGFVRDAFTKTQSNDIDIDVIVDAGRIDNQYALDFVQSLRGQGIPEMSATEANAQGKELWMVVRTVETHGKGSVPWMVHLQGSSFTDGIEFIFVQTTENEFYRRYIENTRSRFNKLPRSSEFFWQLEAPCSSLQYDISKKSFIDITGCGIQDAIKKIWRCPLQMNTASAVHKLQWALQQSVDNIVNGTRTPRRPKLLGRMFKFIERGFTVEPETVQLLCRPLILLANCVTHRTIGCTGEVNDEMRTHYNPNIDLLSSNPTLNTDIHHAIQRLIPISILQVLNTITTAFPTVKLYLMGGLVRDAVHYGLSKKYDTSSERYTHLAQNANVFDFTLVIDSQDKQDNIHTRIKDTLLKAFPHLAVNIAGNSGARLQIIGPHKTELEIVYTDHSQTWMKREGRFLASGKETDRWLLDSPMNSLMYEPHSKQLYDLHGQGIQDAMTRTWQCPVPIPDNLVETLSRVQQGGKIDFGNIDHEQAKLCVQWVVQGEVTLTREQPLQITDFSNTRKHISNRMYKFKARGYDVPKNTNALVMLPCLQTDTYCQSLAKPQGGQRHTFLLDKAQPVHIFVDEKHRTYREKDLANVTTLLDQLLRTTHM